MRSIKGYLACVIILCVLLHVSQIIKGAHEAFVREIQEASQTTETRDGVKPHALCADGVDDPEGFHVRTDLDNLTWDTLKATYPDLREGGRWSPANCTARHRLAVVIPYRNRDAHLRGFLYNMHAFLQRQRMDYQIFVVEQWGNSTFNRAKLLNIGFLEARRMAPELDCYTFHDVDTVPEDLRLKYVCPEGDRTATHLGVAIQKQEYRLPYPEFAGGITLFSDKQYARLNGMSNRFWGWGGEDDDFWLRFHDAQMVLVRPPAETSHMRSFVDVTPDKGNDPNSCRHKLIDAGRKIWREDGLADIKYRLVSVSSEPSGTPLYTRILVDVVTKQDIDVAKQTRRMFGCSGLRMDDASGKPIIIQSLANKKLVSAKKRDDDDALSANHDEADESEVFSLVENADGTVSFQSMGYGLFVTVDLSRDAALISSSDSADYFVPY
ncbi:Protein BRE-4 [Aphelenchoides avenae]|nr:Protein BRE-4 [Aphelenchus avenae]